MKVWIEHDYCTGDGLCADLCPGVFEMDDDGLAHVKAALGEPAPDAPGIAVPEPHETEVLDAQAQCAGECIYVSR